MAIEIGLFGSGSPDDSIDSKHRVVDILEAGEKSLKSSTLESFNKKAQRLAAGILTVDDDENVEDLPAYDGVLMDNEEDGRLVFPSDIFDTSDDDDDDESDKDSSSDGEDDEMSDSDTLLED